MLVRHGSFFKNGLFTDPSFDVGVKCGGLALDLGLECHTSSLADAREHSC